ncbi:heparinase II/III domain-containing protein [Chitinibacteraceae bacterium HSL-7]
MHRYRYPSMLCLAAILISACGFSNSATPLLLPELEEDAQNPPFVTWPVNGSVAVNITYNGQPYRSFTTSAGYWLSDAPLAEGKYCWQASQSGKLEASSCLTITSKSPKLEDFSKKEFWAPNLARPMLTEGLGLQFATAADTPEGAAKRRRLKDVTRRYAGIADSYTKLGAIMTAAGVQSGQTLLANYKNVDKWSDKVFLGALAYYYTGDIQYRTEVSKQVGELIGQCEDVALSMVDERASRTLLWAVAASYDLFGYKDPNAASWANCAEMLARSSGTSADKWDNGARLQSATEYNAFSASLASAILISDRSTWGRSYAERNGRYFAYAGNPFWLKDGGYISGGAYQQWTISTNAEWLQLIAKTTRYNPLKHVWFGRATEYYAQALRPSAPSSLFGDGHENPVLPIYTAALMYHVDSAFAGWYRTYLNFDNLSTEEMLTSRIPGFSTAPKYPESFKIFPLTGIAAMHQSGPNPAGVSVYVRTASSGVKGHSHADLGALLAQRGATPLLVNSGRYDWYGSQQWTEFYQQGVSHNLPSYSGGKGQSLMGAYYQSIASYSDTGKAVSLGLDLGGVYTGPVKGAKRSVVYVRPNMLVVRDTLQSDSDLGWEWNLHTVQPMVATSATTWRAGDVCVRALDGTKYSFAVIPHLSYYATTSMAQFEPVHNQWKAPSAGKKLDALFLIDLACGEQIANPVVDRDENGILTFVVDGVAIRSDLDGYLKAGM